MRRTSLHWLLGVVTVIVAAAVYVLLEAITLAIAAGLVWGGATGITVHFRSQFPEHTTGSSWTDSRWTALGVAIITFATLLGVNAIDGLSTPLRFVLAAVALGTGFVGYLTGSMAERERSSHP